MPQCYYYTVISNYSIRFFINYPGVVNGNNLQNISNNSAPNKSLYIGMCYVTDVFGD